MSRLVFAALTLQLTGAVGCGAVGALDGATSVADVSIKTSADAHVDARAMADSSRDTFELVSDAVPDAVDAAEAPGPHVCPTASTPKDCSMGTGTGEGDQCKDPPCCYVEMVQKVIRDLVSSKPIGSTRRSGARSSRT